MFWSAAAAAPCRHARLQLWERAYLATPAVAPVRSGERRGAAGSAAPAPWGRKAHAAQVAGNGTDTAGTDTADTDDTPLVKRTIPTPKTSKTKGPARLNRAPRRLPLILMLFIQIPALPRDGVPHSFT